MNQGNTPDGGLNWIRKKDYYSEILTIKIQGLIKIDNTIIVGFKGGDKNFYWLYRESLELDRSGPPFRQSGPLLRIISGSSTDHNRKEKVWKYRQTVYETIHIKQVMGKRKSNRKPGVKSGTFTGLAGSTYDNRRVTPKCK